MTPCFYCGRSLMNTVYWLRVSRKVGRVIEFAHIHCAAPSVTGGWVAPKVKDWRAP